MNSVLQKIVRHKRTEIEHRKSNTPLAQLEQQLGSAPAPRDFLSPLQQPGVRLIAEVKKASPSAGIIREDFNPVDIASAYSDSGAACVSVLTDEEFFQGSLDYLISIRKEVEIPILRKDFILDPYQVIEARAAGADAVLLIAECLDPEDLKRLHQLIEELGMIALVELYDEANLQAVLDCHPKLVGVNNRDLNDFSVNLNHSIQLRQKVPSSVCFVSESGIYTPEDVQQLESAGVDAMLVGESLMKSPEIATAVRKLLGIS